MYRIRPQKNIVYKRDINRKNREDRVKSIYNHLVEWEEKGIHVYYFTPYQYRFILGNHRIDYYPTSGKYHDITLKHWGVCAGFKIGDLFQYG